jgi:acetylornithine deacetylase
MPQQTYTPVEMIERLVSFDTTSRNSNLELIHFVRDYLNHHGVAVDLVHNDEKTKANLYATLGEKRDGGVVLSGHTDVVPVDGQDWTSDPFSVRAAEGRLYGRGTADMKSFIAIALALAPEFLARDLKIPIHLALSYDEEVGCIGAHGLVPSITVPGARPKAVIVGEPTNMRVVNAHKGINAFRTAVSGLEAHSSAPQLGINAIIYAAELISFLATVAEELKQNADPLSRFDPPYTSIQVGRIEGGTALNIIPKECTFYWEFRDVPDEDPDALLQRFNDFAQTELLPRMRAVSDKADIVTTATSRVSGLFPENGSAAETLVMALVGSNQTFTAAYGTEAGIFQGAGVPTVVCGPGDISQAHKPDEFIELAQIEECTAFMRRLMDHMSRE